MKNIQEMLDILAEQNCKIEKTKYGAIIITPSVKREPEEPKFKDGDFVYYSKDNHGLLIEYVFIFKGIEGETIKQYLSICKIDKLCAITFGDGVFNDEGLNDGYRLATEDEKQLFFNTIHKERKIWNPETRTTEEDRAPRVGDKCVMWHDGNKTVIVSELRLITLSNVKEYHSDEYGIYTRCVRFEDYDFETMKPKP